MRDARFMAAQHTVVRRGVNARFGLCSPGCSQGCSLGSLEAGGRRAHNPWPMSDHPERLAASPAVTTFRVYAGLAFSFAWIPVMFTALTIDRGFVVDQYVELWALYYLVMVLVEVPLGWLADRIGKRPLLVAGPATLALSFLVLGRATQFDTCLIAMAVTGAGHAMISGADSAYLYDLLVHEGRRGDALREESLAHRWRLFGVSIADLAGGFIAWWLGTASAFYLSALLMLAALVAAVRLPNVTVIQPADQAAVKRPLLTTLLRRDVLWVFSWYALLFVLLRVGFQLYQPTLLAVGAHDLRLHGGLLCLLNLVAGFSAGSVGPVHRRLGEGGTIAAILLLVAVSFAGLAIAGPWALAPLFCLQQVSFAYLQPLGRTALNQRIDSSDRAAVLSAQSMAGRLAFSLFLWLGDWQDAVNRDLSGSYASLAVGAVALTLVLLWLRPAGQRSDGPRAADA
jgi:MFS family permease